jgi:hypothetical protein
MAGVISTVTGTRTEPMDSYKFVRGTTATFKQTYTSGDKPIKVDTGTKPVLKIIAPRFVGSDEPTILATIEGELVAGQEFEYFWTWDIPVSQLPLDNYSLQYQGRLGGVDYIWGSEFFTVLASPDTINIKNSFYATVDDVRKKKFNIDSYLPSCYADDLTSRNNLIEDHLRDASLRLREELNLSQSRGNSENYRLFAIYYTVWSIMLASRGEDGSSISDQNLIYWRSEWERILAQEKREGQYQGVPLGRG